MSEGVKEGKIEQETSLVILIEAMNQKILTEEERIKRYYDRVKQNKEDIPK